MSKHSEAGGKEFIKIGEKQYLLNKIGPGILEAVREKVRSQSEDPLERIVPILQDEKIDVIVRQAMGVEAQRQHRDWGSFASPEAREFCSTVEGMAFTVWCLARGNHPDVSYEQFAAEIGALDDEQMAKLWGDFSGLGDDELEEALKDVDPQLRRQSLKESRRRKQQRKRKNRRRRKK
jgi:hypothetical protein